MAAPPPGNFLIRNSARTLHKWLALFVGLQVLIWVVGGTVFALLPFEAWVKSGERVVKSIKPKADAPVRPLAEVAAAHAPLHSLELIGQGKTLYYRGTSLEGKKFLIDAATAKRVDPIDESTVRTLAAGMYAGTGTLRSVTLVERIERRMGLVDEMGGRVPAWRVTYDDRFSTRLYFDPASGEFLRARNDAWVLYDFFWRLHIMDYGGGEDFNNAFLRVLAPLALIFVLSGALLLFFVRFRRVAKHSRS